MSGFWLPLLKRRSPRRRVAKYRDRHGDELRAPRAGDHAARQKVARSGFGLVHWLSHAATSASHDEWPRSREGGRLRGVAYVRKQSVRFRDTCFDRFNCARMMSAMVRPAPEEECDRGESGDCAIAFENMLGHRHPSFHLAGRGPSFSRSMAASLELWLKRACIIDRTSARADGDPFRNTGGWERAAFRTGYGAAGTEADVREQTAVVHFLASPTDHCFSFAIRSPPAGI